MQLGCGWAHPACATLGTFVPSCTLRRAHSRIAHLEVCDGALAVTLVLATMQAEAGVAGLEQVAEQGVTFLLQWGE